jgi:hypothetical protein
MRYTPNVGGVLNRPSFFGVVRVLHHLAATLDARALEQVLAGDHQRDARRAQVLLRARVDQPVLRHVDRPAEDVARRVAHEERPARRRRLGIRNSVPMIVLFEVKCTYTGSSE